MNIKFQFKVERRLGNPNIRILVDEHMSSFEGECPDELELDLPLAPGDHELRITHYGKQPEHHEYNEAGELVVDRSVEILSIEFDGVPLREVLWEGAFFPVYLPEYVEDQTRLGIEVPYSITPNLYLGHNGTWRLKFIYPSTDWLIERRKHTFNQPVGAAFQTSEAMLLKTKQFFNQVKDLGWRFDV
jgi:hypothetical protein